MDDESRANLDRIRELEEELQGCRAALEQAHTDYGYLRALFETLPTGVAITDRHGEYTLVNPTARELLGGEFTVSIFQPSERYSVSHLDGTLFPAYDYPIVRALQHGEASHNVSMVIRYHETERILMVGANPVRDAEGNIIGAVATFDDVTVRHNAEVECQRLLSEREATTESIPDALVVFATDGTILHMNHAAERLFQYTDDDRKLPISERWHRHRVTQPDGTLLPEERIPAERALHGETIQGEVLAFHPMPDETIWLSVSSAPVLSPQGRILGAVTIFTDITAQEQFRQERERLLTTIEERVAELDAMFSSLPHAVAMYSLSGEIIMTNACGVDTLGFTPDECRLPVEVRWAHLQVETPDGRPFPLHEVPPRHAMQGEVLRNIELVLHRPEGRRWLLVSAAPVRIGERIIGAVAIFSDITSRKQTEEALRESEHNLAQSQAVAHVGNWTWDAEHDCITWSTEIYRIFGVSVGDFGKTLDSVTAYVHPDDQAGFTAYFTDILSGRPRAQYEVRIIRPDGTIRQLLLMVGETATLAHGVPTRAFGVVQDITERKRVEDALRDSEARYRAFSESTSEGIALHELGQILEVNQTFANHLGYAPEEMLGRSVLEFTAPESREEMARRFQAGDPGPYVAISLHRDGSRTIGEIRARDIMYKGHPTRVVAVRDITAQKRAEDALRESETKFRNLFEHMSESVTVDEMLFDNAGRPCDWIIRDINPAYEQIFQIPREHAIGQRGTVLYPFIAQAHQEFEEYARRLERGEAVQMEFPDRHTGRHLLISAIPMGAHHFSTVSTDITERKQAEEERERLLSEVKRRAAELGASFSAINEPILLFDTNEIVKRANAATTDLVGKEITGMPHAEIVRALEIRHPDGTLLHEEESPVLRATRGEVVTDVHVLITDFQGRVFEMLVSANPLQQDDVIWGVVSYWHDITERERLLREVERRAAEVDASLNSIADGVVIFAPDGTIARINPTGERLTGFHAGMSAEPLEPGLPIPGMETPDGEPVPLERMPPIRALRGETVRGELLVFQPPLVPQPVWVSVSAAPLCLSDGTQIGAVVIITDITALHQLQEQQKALLQTVSHDLRTPLSVIKGYEQLVVAALKTQGIDGMIQQSLAAIDRGVTRMDVMIQDLVDITRWEGGQLELQFEAVELPHYINDFLQRVGMVIDTTRIQVEMAADLSPVRADYSRLERIFTNILSNALKYSAPGTPVVVRAQRTDGEVTISVIDQGPGITPDEIPHLFERFYRAYGERKREGIGLGLYIARMLAEAHGGRIWAESTVGKGSIFHFTLQVADVAG